MLRLTTLPVPLSGFMIHCQLLWTITRTHFNLAHKMNHEEIKGKVKLRQCPICRIFSILRGFRVFTVKILYHRLELKRIATTRLALLPRFNRRRILTGIKRHDGNHIVDLSHSGVRKQDIPNGNFVRLVRYNTANGRHSAVERNPDGRQEMNIRIGKEHSFESFFEPAPRLFGVQRWCTRRSDRSDLRLRRRSERLFTANGNGTETGTAFRESTARCRGFTEPTLFPLCRRRRLVEYGVRFQNAGSLEKSDGASNRRTLRIGNIGLNRHNRRRRCGNFWSLPGRGAASRFGCNVVDGPKAGTLGKAEAIGIEFFQCPVDENLRGKSGPQPNVEAVPIQCPVQLLEEVVALPPYGATNKQTNGGGKQSEHRNSKSDERRKTPLYRIIVN